MSNERYGIIIPSTDYTLLLAPTPTELEKIEELITFRRKRDTDLVITDALSCLKCVRHPGVSMTQLVNSVKNGIQEVFFMEDGSVTVDRINYITHGVSHSPECIILKSDSMVWYNHAYLDQGKELFTKGSFDLIRFVEAYKDYTTNNPIISINGVQASKSLWEFLIQTNTNKIAMNTVGLMINNPYADTPNGFFRMIKESDHVEYFIYARYPNAVFDTSLNTAMIAVSDISDALASAGTETA